MLLPMHSVVLLLINFAHLSIQAPPRTRHKYTPEEIVALFPKGASLLDIVKNRPRYYFDPVGREFAKAFASHADIRGIDKLPKEDLIKKALELRQQTIDGQHKDIKRKFTVAMYQHMENNNVDKDVQLDLKAAFAKSRRISNDRDARKRSREQKPAEYAAKRTAENVRSRMRKKQRQDEIASRGGISPFEEMIQGLKLPSNPSAKQIEKAVRNVTIDSGGYTTAQLRKYLSKKFSSQDVDDAMAMRSLYLLYKSDQRKLEESPSGGAKRRKQDLMPSVSSPRAYRSDLSAASSSVQYLHPPPHQPPQPHSQASSSSGLAIENQANKTSPPSSRSPARSPDHSVDPLDNHFHPTDWWEGLYQR